jgi:SAM-dependent methyltransferase
MTKRPRDFFDSLDAARWGRAEMPQQERITREWIERTGAAGIAVELGCGAGALRHVMPRYVGIDLSMVALRIQNGRGAQADMEQLPFRDDSIDLIWSWAAIEHVPHPEVVLDEVVRVLRPGGVAILAPAWHCRTWAAEGLEFRPMHELTRSQRIRKRLVPLRSSPLWQGLFEMPKRVSRELRARRGPLPFEFSRLTPNLDQYLGTDSDAFTSMDPQAMVLFFATRGFEIVSHPTLRARMLARSEPVVVRKPR